MGLFDLPAPLFTAIDNVMAIALPATLRLVTWAMVASVGTMFLYKALSPQKHIGQAKRDAKAARRRLNEFDGDFADAGPLIRDQFVTAFKQLGLVVPGTVLAILPLLCLLVWAETHYGQALPPPGQTPAIATVPQGFQTHWNGQDEPPRLRVEKNGRTLTEVDMVEPVGVLTKRPWWHWLAANPIGYLPDDSPVQQVRISLPVRHYLPFGPEWMRSWLAVFIPIMFIVSLTIYKWARIE